MEEIIRLRRENTQIKERLSEKEIAIGEKRKQLDPGEKYVSKLYSLMNFLTKYNLISPMKSVHSYSDLSSKIERGIKELSRNLEINKTKKKIVREALVKYIVKWEKQRKIEKRQWLKDQEFRLGKLTYTKAVTQQIEAKWEDGEEFKKVKLELEHLREEREQIEKSKKILKAKLRQNQNANSDGSEDSIIRNDAEFQMKLNLMEEKEILAFKMNLNQKLELKTQEKLNALEKEKILYQVELNTANEEERSKLCGKNIASPFEILDDKYLILSLLGRGGYSEVYKAYDLDNWREVACKIHHFDNNWSESLKASYIKHALRENKTHKELNHPRVVKQFDTVEIDNNSFWTILELWSGPDLFLYLKQHGWLPEKEAKLIISQILSGLKYLNEREIKIIHFDLKPQNILFHNGEIKISDFGLWKELERDKEKIELTSQGVGTYWYQPPEWFEEGPNPAMISSKVDVWSVGVIFYELLYGLRPFGDKQSQKKILREKTIINDAKQVHFPSKPAVSTETKEFIKALLSYNIEDRLSVEQAYFQIINK